MNPPTPSPSVSVPTPLSVPSSDSSITTPPPPLKNSTPSKKLFIIIPLIILILIAGVSFVLSRPKPVTKVEPTPQPLDVEDQLADFDGINVREDTVQVAKNEDKYYIKFKNKIYTSQDDHEKDLEEVQLSNSESYRWHGLIDPPVDLTKDDKDKNQIFGFKTFSDNQSFVFVMRWFRVTGQNFEVYSVVDSKVELISSYRPTQEELAYRVPKLYEFSPDKALISLKMYDCWECEREYPQTILLDLVKKNIKVIGLTSYFKWNSGGEYIFKSYIPTRSLEEIPTVVGKFGV